MSKLEDKLSASIKPAKGKAPASARPARNAKPAPAEKKPVSPGPEPEGPTERTAPARPLHPRRVWPD